MPLGTIQKHFDHHHVEYVGRGKQAVVHGTPRLVVKQHDPLPDMVPQSAERFHRSYHVGRERLGGLVVPFATPPALTIKKPGFFGLFPSSSTVAQPVVQERFDHADVLSARLVAGLADSRYHEVRDMLRSWIDVNVDSAHRGVFLGDFHFGNYVVAPNGSIQAHDIGLSLIGNDWRRMSPDHRALDIARSFYNARLHFSSLVRCADNGDAGLEIVHRFHDALFAALEDGFECSPVKDAPVSAPQLKD